MEINKTTDTKPPLIQTKRITKKKERERDTQMTKKNTIPTNEDEDHEPFHALFLEGKHADAIAVDLQLVVDIAQTTECVPH